MALSHEVVGSTERSRKSIHGTKDSDYGCENPDRTLCDLFEQGRSKTGDGPFLGTTDGTVSYHGDI